MLRDRRVDWIEMSSKQQITLRELLVWFVLLSAYFTILSAQSSIQQAFQSPSFVPPAWFLYLACWIILLVHYIHLRQIVPGLIHTVVPLLAVFLCYSLGVRTKEILTPACAAAIWFGAVAAFPVSIAKSIEFGFGKESNFVGYFCFNVFVSMLILVPVCVVGYWILARKVVPPIVFGVLLSLWCGLYQSMSTSERWRKSEFLGMSTRVLVTAGFLGALFGPIAYWYLSRWYGLYFIPPRYSPAIGVPIALICGALARWYTHNDEPAENVPECGR